MSADLAKRDDLRRSLVETAWDLVVVDEAHQLVGQRLALVAALAEQPTVALLLATHRGLCSDVTVAVGAEVVDWSSGFTSHMASMSVLRESRNVVSRTYLLSCAEIALLDAVRAVAATARDAQADMLARAVTSSAAAVESELYSLLDGSPAAGDNERVLVFEALARLDAVAVDSKIAACVALVCELVVEHRAVAVYCEHRATVALLAAALSETGTRVERLGSVRENEKSSVVRSFEEHHGVLVALTAAAYGVLLRSVDAVVHYDIPSSPEAAAKRRSTYQAVGAAGPLTECGLTEATGAFPWERWLVESLARTAAPPPPEQEEVVGPLRPRDVLRKYGATSSLTARISDATAMPSRCIPVVVVLDTSGGCRSTTDAN